MLARGVLVQRVLAPGVLVHGVLVQGLLVKALEGNALLDKFESFAKQISKKSSTLYTEENVK